MKICFLSCGIYQPELDLVLAQITKEELFDCEITVIYLPARLHVDFNSLKEGILKALDNIVADRIILLYGSKCHPEFQEFLQGRQLIRFEQSNCIELMLGERMGEIDRIAKTIYVTPGWAIYWEEFFNRKSNSNENAIKQSFSFFNQLLFVDTGACEVSKEKIREISKYTGLANKTEKIGLEVFKNNIIAAIRQAV